MIIFFPILLLLAAALSFPAYRYSCRNKRESRWLPWLSLPALILWLGLTAFGYGSQSLSNIIESFWLVGTGIRGYLKVFVLDSKRKKNIQHTYLLMAALALGAFMSRTFMPLLPE
jgi:hypothetical protein